MRPLSREQVQTIKRLLEAEGNKRDLALFSTAIDTMLRGVDLLALTVADVTNHEGQIRDEFMVRQRKTGKGTLVSLTPYTQKVLAQWIAESYKLPWAPLFTRLRGDPNQEAIKPCQYRTLVKIMGRLRASGSCGLQLAQSEAHQGSANLRSDPQCRSGASAPGAKHGLSDVGLSRRRPAPGA